jgi:glyoxylase-like metal-dependent hydrolase (beta-lactamase superfamily II)
MFKVKKYDGFTLIMMGSSIEGRVPYHVALYHVDGVLIDTGSYLGRWDLLDYAAGRDILMAVNTHHHIDHIGANKLLLDRLRIPIFAPGSAVPVIAKTQDIFPYQMELWGRPEPCPVNPLGRTVHTKNHILKVLHTGGHSPDHVVFFLSEKGWLFTGDEFITERPNAARKDEDASQSLRVLRMLLKLNPEYLMTSSGTVYADASAVLKRSLRYLEGIDEQIRAMKKKNMSAAQMVVALFGGETPLKAFTGGQFSRENFVKGFLKRCR